MLYKHTDKIKQLQQELASQKIRAKDYEFRVRVVACVCTLGRSGVPEDVAILCTTASLIIGSGYLLPPPHSQAVSGSVSWKHERKALVEENRFLKKMVCS